MWAFNHRHIKSKHKSVRNCCFVKTNAHDRVFFLELPSADATKEMLRDIDHFNNIEYIQGSKVNVALKTAR